MIKVVLHGYLKKLYPHDIEVEANTAAQALGFLKMIPELTPKMGSLHQVQVVGFPTPESLYQRTPAKEIHVVPHIAGGKRGGLIQIIIGVVLIAAAIWTGGVSLGGMTLLTATEAALLGTAMLLGGLLQMFAPTPKLDTGGSADDSQQAKYLAASQNTVRVGTRIPVLYGERKVGGHFLSFNINAKTVTANA